VTSHETRVADPTYEERPWGHYEVLTQGPQFKVKRIVVRAGHQLSYQRHEHRDEHWVFVQGHGAATLDGTVVPVSAGSRLEARRGVAHRVTCTGDDDLVLIEVQLGSYLGEDDIVRLSDDYGR
jgi:mannose-6-phosphate isomerase-like protein (cupin superfamily)